ncbi:cobalt-precorrin-6A reductase [Aetokthonos hydrillicola Thurmond2011]|uniref:Cobalt-precorrin-6A reductase n=2 Tax=Aetokthonos TaxID=1550243 RepID=A0AAP5M7X0_9CYAN|nr:cobalt-precorrin-6A reductase [Aetokthonos hydrillicola]MBW4583756.1 cobalt-precorrin-6A reductase [Aetokthonos hydrillicola CCALA 1050]MDR9895550.1 cobalt-precorrin-6A reductase [Aetokthonos hydrillicola Thurmond2011]
MKKRVLILGGTGDASKLAAKATTLPGIEVIVSLAGRTPEPLPIAGTLRVGGFGGVDGLTTYLRDEAIDLLIDATHPFAAQISFNASAAADELELPRIILVRPAWESVPGDQWINVDSIAAAADVLEGQAKRVFLTIGRQQLAAFAHLHEIWFLMRLINQPESEAVLPNGLFLFSQGPFDLTAERELLMQYQIDTLVTKNSGGNATYAKIIAARELGINVVMVNRPPIPQGEQVKNVEEAFVWLCNQISSVR